MNADQITLPMTGWILQPSFRLKQVTLVERCQWVSAPGWFRCEAGKTIHASAFYKTREEAISAGQQRLADQQKALDVKQDNLNKRSAMLAKEAAK